MIPVEGVIFFQVKVNKTLVGEVRLQVERRVQKKELTFTLTRVGV